jgi:hypothetical protein
MDNLEEWSLRNITDVISIFKEVINTPSDDIAVNTDSKKEKTHIIEKDDILNLKIILGQTQNIDDFINRI